MRLFKSRESEKDCRICGSFNNSPLSIARAVTGKVLESEKMHSHPASHEFYIILKGRAELIVNDVLVPVVKGDVVLIEPGESHKISRILEETDYITIKESEVKETT